MTHSTIGVLVTFGAWYYSPESGYPKMLTVPTLASLLFVFKRTSSGVFHFMKCYNCLSNPKRGSFVDNARVPPKELY